MTGSDEDRYIGHAGFAVTILDRLIAAGHEIDLVFTQPDRPKGPRQKAAGATGGRICERTWLKLLQPESIRTPEIEALLAESAPDVVIIAAYGRIIPDALLKMPKYGYINVHASLLPRYRGAAPIQWALRNGDAETGVSIMKLESGLDEGPVYKMAKLAIAPEWNKKDLFDALAVLGADCLLETLAEIDSLTPVAQDHANATYAPMFDKQDGCIDFAQPAKVLVDLSRALSRTTVYTHY